MKVLKAVDPRSAANIVAILMALWGLVVGIMVSLNFAVLDFTGRMFRGFEMMGLGPAVGILGLIIFPIVYGISGFIAGYLFAWLYNLIAKKFGGIKLDI